MLNIKETTERKEMINITTYRKYGIYNYCYKIYFGERIMGKIVACFNGLKNKGFIKFEDKYTGEIIIKPFYNIKEWSNSYYRFTRHTNLYFEEILYEAMDYNNKIVDYDDPYYYFDEEGDAYSDWDL